jgi:hypothetical protein
MSAAGEKIACKVRRQAGGKLDAGFDGLAHIVRAVYDPAFSVCYGSVLVACTPEEAMGLMQPGGVFYLHLEDGRLVEVRPMGGSASRSMIRGGVLVGEDGNLIYFVATTRLRDPLADV